MINPELKKRLLSLVWRAGGAGVVAILAVVFKALPDLEKAGIPVLVTALIALVINEITKGLNKKYQLGSKFLGVIKGKDNS